MREIIIILWLLIGVSFIFYVTSDERDPIFSYVLSCLIVIILGPLSFILNTIFFKEE